MCNPHELVPHPFWSGVKICAWCGKTRDEILNQMEKQS